MGDTGLEQISNSLGNPQVSSTRGAKSGAADDGSATIRQARLPDSQARAMAAILSLPISDAEKVQMLRRLLGNGDPHPT